MNGYASLEDLKQGYMKHRWNDSLFANILIMDDDPPGEYLDDDGDLTPEGEEIMERYTIDQDTYQSIPGLTSRGKIIEGDNADLTDKVRWLKREWGITTRKYRKSPRGTLAKELKSIKALLK